MMNLLEAREARGLTQTALAQKAGLSKAQVYRIEKGTSTPALATAQKIAGVLEVMVNEIEELEARIEQHTDSPDKAKIKAKAAPIARNPFEATLTVALECKGLSREEVCRLIGIHIATLQNWIRTNELPQRHGKLTRIKRLAEVLDCPALVPDVKLKPRQIVMTCTTLGCEVTLTCKPEQIRATLRKGYHPEAVVDFNSGLGTYRCAICSQRNNMKNIHRKMVKKHGRKWFHEKAEENFASLTEDRRNEGLRKAQESHVGIALSEKHRLNLTAAKLSPKPSGKFGICRVCGLLTFRGQDDRPTETHRPCLDGWLSERGLFARDAYPPRGRGRLLSHSELAISYEICVRHLLRGEPIGKYDGGVEEGLAGVFKKSRRTMIQRIQSFLKYLPIDGRGSARLHRWSKALLRAGASQGYSI